MQFLSIIAANLLMAKESLTKKHLGFLRVVPVISFTCIYFV